MQTELEVYKLRERIIHLEAEVDFLYKHLGITFVPEPRTDDDPKIVELVRKGDLLGAIKMHRELFGSGPQEAKSAIEEMKGRLGL